jgi:hypothetical protein
MDPLPDPPIITKPGMLPNATYLDDFSHLTNLKIFGTEIGYKNKNNNNVGNNTGYRGKCT